MHSCFEIPRVTSSMSAVLGFHSGNKGVEKQLILDAHTHAFPDAVARAAVEKLTASARYCPVRASHDGTVRGLLSCMDRSGVTRAFVLSVATRPEQVKKITDWAASIASERLIPFASIHPDLAEPEREAERIARLGLRGIKFHPHYMNCAADDLRTLRIAKAAEAANLAMVFHAGYDVAYPEDERAAPERLLRVHEAAPKLRMLLAHFGGWRAWDQVLRHLAGRSVYLETSWIDGFCQPDLVQAILAKHDPRRVLFGTDTPWGDPSKELAHFARLPISPAPRSRMLWDNALRFVGLDA